MSAIATSRSRRPRMATVAVLIALGALLLAGQPAGASDEGNWAGSCYDIGRGCMWKSNIGASFVLGSPSRDSNFSYDFYYSGPGGELNDNVKNMTNSFSTLHIRAYLNANYVTASTCIGGGVSIGPYVTGSHDGISSFKSC